jgi:putative redox protein
MTRGIVHIGRDCYRTQIEVGGHLLLADESWEHGGRSAGPSPYDFILAGLGACTAITLRNYADRREWPLQSVDIFLCLIQEPAGLRIERSLCLSGGVNRAQKLRLADIAERTPVTLTLKHALTICTKLI